MERTEFETSRRFTRDKAHNAFKTFGPAEDVDDLADAKAPRTMIQYASAWRVYTTWCEGIACDPMPADAEQLLAYVRHLRAQKRAPATIEAYVAAIATVHRLNGYAVDRTKIVEPMKAARRRAGPPRRARALLGRTLRDLVERLDPSSPRDVRDATLMLLGFAGALRSAELVGLDWERPGRSDFGGTGYLAADPRGLLIELATSKASQLTPVQLAIPGKDMPSLTVWLGRWVKLAGIAPGEPVFRAFHGGRILPRRIASETVLAIVRQRMRAYALATGKPEAEALVLANAFSSHSLRRGYCTTAAEKRLSLGEIRGRSRHSGDAVLGRYIASAEGWRRSGLAGVGF